MRCRCDLSSFARSVFCGWARRPTHQTANRLRASVDFTDESKHESPDSRVGASKRTIGLQKMPVHPHRIGEDHGRLAGAPELPPCAVNLITPIGPARLRKLLWVDVPCADWQTAFVTWVVNTYARERSGLGAVGERVPCCQIGVTKDGPWPRHYPLTEANRSRSELIQVGLWYSRK